MMMPERSESMIAIGVKNKNLQQMVSNLNIHKPNINYAKAILDKMDEKTRKEVKDITRMLIQDSNKLLMTAQGHGFIPDVLKIDNKVGQTVFRDVRYVDLSNNDVQEIEGSFCRNLEALTHLDLRNNRIKTISEHMRALMNLTVLRLDGNQLSNLPLSITSLRMLEELSLSGNRIEEIPE